MTKKHRRRGPRRKKPVSVPAITPVRATAERLQRAGDGAIVEAAPAGPQRIIAAPIDRLLSVGFLTQREHDAGDKLRSDVYLAAIDPAAQRIDWSPDKIAGYTQHVPSMWTSQQVADARIRHRRLRRAINGVVWDVLFLAVVKEREFKEIGRTVFNVGDEREAVVAARAGLRIALGALADFYEGRPR